MEPPGAASDSFRSHRQHPPHPGLQQGDGAALPSPLHVPRVSCLWRNMPSETRRSPGKHPRAHILPLSASGCPRGLRRQAGEVLFRNHRELTDAHISDVFQAAALIPPNNLPTSGRREPLEAGLPLPPRGPCCPLDDTFQTHRERCPRWAFLRAQLLLMGTAETPRGAPCHRARRWAHNLQGRGLEDMILFLLRRRKKHGFTLSLHSYLRL